MTRVRVVQKKERIDLLGWPTDVVSVDATAKKEDDDEDNIIHTVIIFIPGNPGQYNWYSSDFREILSSLGCGFAIRSISHAGHGVGDDTNSDNNNNNNNSITNVKDYSRSENNNIDASIPWDVDGQVHHKIAYIDSVLLSQQHEQQQQRRRRHKQLNQLERKQQQQSHHRNSPRFIFVGHSFGCHVIQRLCVLRPDILERTIGILFIMPYIRTLPRRLVDRKKLDFFGNNDRALISIGTKISQTLRCLPESIVRPTIVRFGTVQNYNESDEITNLVMNLLRQVDYPTNFFNLGLEEIRDIPNEIDVPGLRILSSIVIPTSSLRNGVDLNVVNNNNNELRTIKNLRQQRNRPICILYAGENDQWCPYFHGKEIQNLQATNVLPPSIKITNVPSGLRHDYVCENQQTRSKVTRWCISNIIQFINDTTKGGILASKL